jgi:uncharacterized protein
MAMAAPTDTFDLGRLRLSSGEGRRLTLGVRLGDFDFGGERYAVEPALVDATLDISRMTGGGYALRLRFDAGLTGPCMRCLEPAAPVTSVDAREVHQPGGGEELTSPYVHDEELDVQTWAHDAYALALPVQVVCTPDCAGLCPECGANLNTAGAGHHHDAAPDPRWAKLRELKFD